MNNNKSRFGELKLIVTNSHPKLGNEIASELQTTPLEIESGIFDDQEPNIWRIGDISGSDVCIFSSLHHWSYTMNEVKQFCSSLQGASRVFGVFSFICTGKSDHQKRFGEPVAYKTTADDLSESGLDLIVMFDQHSAQHPHFYDLKHHRLRVVHHIYLMRILIEYARDKLNFDGLLAFDDGSFKRNAKIAEFLKTTNVSFIIKHRDPDSRQVDINKSIIIGDVKNKRILSFEDMCQSSGTVITGAKIAKMHGAKEVTVLIVHNDFGVSTFDNLNPALEQGIIDKVIVLETIPLIRANEWHSNLIVLSPAKFIAQVISCVHEEGHMRQFFLPIS